LAVPQSTRGIVCLAILILSVLTIACKPQARYQWRLAPQPLPPGHWKEVELDRGWITVSLGLPNTGSPPYPVVLNPILPERNLLDRGIAVARFRTNWEILRAFRKKPEPDPAATQKESNGDPEPEAVGNWLLQSDRAETVGQAYFQLIAQDSEKTLPRVLDFLARQPEVDAERIAITGSSTSGFLALQAMAAEPRRLRAAAVQIACGSYRSFLRSSSLALDNQEKWLPAGEVRLDPAYEAELMAVDPIHKTGRFPPRPLLLISGARDHAIPRNCVFETVSALRESYQRAGVPDRFVWREFEESGHETPPEASEMIFDFLVEALAVVPPERSPRKWDTGSVGSGGLLDSPNASFARPDSGGSRTSRSARHR
jgi:predicted esterase